MSKAMMAKANTIGLRGKTKVRSFVIRARDKAFIKASSSMAENSKASMGRATAAGLGVIVVGTARNCRARVESELSLPEPSKSRGRSFLASSLSKAVCVRVLFRRVP